MNAALFAINVINIAAGILYVLILARIFVSWLPLHPWHPIVRWLRVIVDPILQPFRRILPSVAGLDLSPLVAILVIFFIAHLAVDALGYFAFGVGFSVSHLIAGLIGQLIENIIIILGILVFIRLLVGLFSADPWHPLVLGVRRITDPLVRPFAAVGHRRVGSGLDVPAVITLALYIALYLVVQFLILNVF